MEITVSSTFKKTDSFRWAVGFEGSFIPHLNIDEYKWTGHDKQWRSDFELVAHDLRCSWVRYPVAWHETEVEPGRFDWRWCDERIEQAARLNIKLIVDLAHFGTPLWLPHAFGDLDFPHALERWARAFSRRYRGVVQHICPFNEPLTSALFGGDMGMWPPFGRGLHDYTTVVSRIAQGISRAVTAIREENPEAEILLTDAVESAITGEDAWHAETARRLQRRHLSLDLVLGRIHEDHPLRPWLLEHGMPRFDLDWFVRNPAQIDVLGIDYYCHSETELSTADDGTLFQCQPECPRGLYRVTRDYWEHYGLPMMISETSCTGSDDDRGLWLDWTLFETRRLRESGIPVLGYTWWPVIDHLDWDGAMCHQTGHIHPVGLYRLERDGHGGLRRCPTGLSEAYKALIERRDDPVGDVLTPAPPTLEQLAESASAAGPHAESSENSTSSQPVISSPRNTLMTPPSSQQNGHANGAVDAQKLISLLSDEGSQEACLDFPVVVHSHLCWDWVWQRPQQFLSRLSNRHRILFCEGPKLVEEDVEPYFSLHEAEGYPNVTIMHTHFPAARFHNGAWVDTERTRLLLEALSGPLQGQFESPVQWFYDPMAVTSFVGQVGEVATVYDCMDQLSQFRFAPPELIERERQLLQAADVVFAGGRKMWEDKKKHNDNAHFYGCGVDIEHFSKALDPATEIPGDIDFARRPVLGYFGVVDERLDYELIAKLAQHNPHWSVCIVGPPCKIDPNELPRLNNLFWLGGRDYSQLPAYTKAFDVCLMPFALNEATEYINPTKALEYMATARPIVSTPVPDVVSNFSEVVKISNGHDEFIRLCEEAIKQRDNEAVERGCQMAQDNTWDAIVAKLEGHINDALAARGVDKTPVSRGAELVSNGNGHKNGSLNGTVLVSKTASALTTASV
jgi:beta-glucosidase/6-phospho-beta-glucosidase/beta-galactosidase/glycosyltransferase involved in cell wall biosynthesis